MDISNILPKLVDAGAAGLLIIVVVIFVNYLSKRESQWQEFLEHRDAVWRAFAHEQNQAVQTNLQQFAEVITAVKNELIALRQDFQAHEVWERTYLEPKTQSRKSKEES